jgi:hypothetical protein
MKSIPRDLDRMQRLIVTALRRERERKKVGAVVTATACLLLVFCVFVFLWVALP